MHSDRTKYRTIEELYNATLGPNPLYPDELSLYIDEDNVVVTNEDGRPIYTAGGQETIKDLFDLFLGISERSSYRRK